MSNDQDWGDMIINVGTLVMHVWYVVDLVAFMRILYIGDMFTGFRITLNIALRTALFMF